ncbi:MAG: Xaa-Pro peptidase family protein [Candidatus Micrarchaeota archaeon]|nr:Xaa-Pro peptidase family protein [Candidatus Micrarchaeota archaeon]
MKIDTRAIRERAKKITAMLNSTVIIPRWGWYSPNFFYFAGMDIDHSIAVLHKDGGITIVSNRLNEELAKECYKGIADVLVYDKKTTAKQILKNICGNGKCVLDASSIPYGAYRRLFSRGMRPASKELLSAREAKDKHEIEVMRQAKCKAASILKKIAREGVIGKSEEMLKSEILVEIAKLGCTEAFGAIVANSLNARFPHYTTAGKHRIRDYVLIDMGVNLKHYNSDITRCIGDLGGMHKTYEALQHASLEVADVAVAGKEISEFARETDAIIKKNGLAAFPHGIGHGIGLEVHEFPHFHTKSRDTLKENSVITIEPGQYGKSGGLRYENMYVIGKKGAKLL